MSKQIEKLEAQLKELKEVYENEQRVKLLKSIDSHVDMTEKEWTIEENQLRAIADSIIETLKAKNHDYAGSTGDFFANFRKHGTLGFLVRMSDKLARLETFEKQGVLKVSDEKIEDTLKDLAGYAMLMAVYLRQTIINSK